MLRSRQIGRSFLFLHDADGLRILTFVFVEPVSYTHLTLDALRFYEVNDQYCFVTQKAIDETLAFVTSYEVRP